MLCLKLRLARDAVMCRLCELNVVRQMYNVATSPTVQGAWERGQKVHIHAYVYSLGDGLLKVRSNKFIGALHCCFKCLAQVDMPVFVCFHACGSQPTFLNG